MNDDIYEHYSVYRKLVDTLTESLKLSGKIQIFNQCDTIDHILPVSFGFNWKIPPDLIADLRNLRVVSRYDNSKKGYKCDEIPKFIQKYMIENHHKTMKEKQKEGIQKAKKRGVYTGRKNGSSETEEQFLNKPKIKKVIEYLELGWKSTKISQEVNIHINTITKVKKILKNNTNKSF